MQWKLCFAQRLNRLGAVAINKTYMTRVERENTRLRHYLARMQLKNFMLLQISRNVKPIGEVGCLLSQT
jgi:IS1 family transposase